MKTAMKMISRVTMLLVVCMLVILSCTPALADGEYKDFNGETRRVFFRTEGNGNEASIFQVAVRRAPATLTFRQQEGLCYEDSYTHFIDGPKGKEEEWGKYHVYYRRQGSTTTYHNVWDKTRRGGEFELYINETGVFYVWLVPYTAQEMTDSWTADIFIRWNMAPYWWVADWTSGTSVGGSPYLMNMDGTYCTGCRLTVYDAFNYKYEFY